MDDIGTTGATCGSGDWDANGYRVRCDDPAPYRAEFSFHDDDGSPCLLDYSLRVCARHAAIARTYDDLKRIFSA